MQADGECADVEPGPDLMVLLVVTVAGGAALDAFFVLTPRRGVVKPELLCSGSNETEDRLRKKNRRKELLLMKQKS